MQVMSPAAAHLRSPWDTLPLPVGPGNPTHTSRPRLRVRCAQPHPTHPCTPCSPLSLCTGAAVQDPTSGPAASLCAPPSFQQHPRSLAPAK